MLSLLTAVASWLTRGTAPAPEDPLANAKFTRFTDWEGTEGGAEISPDGKFVAFVADKAGQFDIWLSQVGTGDFRNLTADIPALQPIGPTFRKFGFSGDGAEIWFSPETGPSMAQMIMPLMGGTPRAFLDKGATAPAWSPDGTRLTYFKNVDGDPLFVADRTGADARQILVQKGMHHHNPVWSSDGQWIYFARGLDPTDAMDVWRVRPSGESPERLTERGTAVNFLAPLDTRTLLYVARAEDRSGPWLWALDVERKVTRRVSSGLGQYTSVSASRDGRRVVATVANPTASLWRVPLLDRQAEDRDVQPYPLPTARAGPALRRDIVVLFVRQRDGRWAVARPGRTGVRSLEGRRRGVVRAARGVAGRKPRGHHRQTGGEAAPGNRVGGRQELTNVGPVPRHSRSGRPRHRGLVAGRHVDRDGRPRRAGSWVCSKSPWIAVCPFGSSPVRPSIPSGRRTGT